MNTTTISEARDHATDMGYVYCEACGATSIPLPGYVNDGHQCGRDGTTDEFIDPDY